MGVTDDLSKSQVMTRSKQSQLIIKTTPQCLMNTPKKSKVTTKKIQSKENYLHGMNKKSQVSTKVKKCQGKTKIKLRKSVVVDDKVTLADRREKKQGDERKKHEEEMDEWGEVCMVQKSVDHHSEEMGTAHAGGTVVLRKPRKLMAFNSRASPFK